MKVVDLTEKRCATRCAAMSNNQLITERDRLFDAWEALDIPYWGGKAIDVVEYERLGDEYEVVDKICLERGLNV